MKPSPINYTATLKDSQSTSELLILPDGRILAHNITSAMAAILVKIDPTNDSMRLRANPSPKKEKHEFEKGN